MADAKRIANSQNQIADANIITVAECESWKLGRRVLQFQNGKVCARIIQHELGLKLATVRQHDGQLLRAVDNMMIGHNQPRTVNNHARAQRLLGAPAGSGKIIAKKLLEKRVIKQPAAALNDAARIDIHNTWNHLFNHRRKGKLNLSGVLGHRARALRMHFWRNQKNRKKPQKNKKTRV